MNKTQAHETARQMVDLINDADQREIGARTDLERDAAQEQRRSAYSHLRAARRVLES